MTHVHIKITLDLRTGYSLSYETSMIVEINKQARREANGKKLRSSELQKRGMFKLKKIEINNLAYGQA